MREKPQIETTRPLDDHSGRSQRVRRDLERRGVASEFSQQAAHRLGDIVSDLSDAEYSAVLEGVAAAYGVHRESGTPMSPELPDVSEVQRLMQGFAAELGKLEEGLQVLSAYVVRMSARSKPAPGTTLH